MGKKYHNYDVTVIPLNESNRFMMQSLNEKFNYDKDIGKKMSWCQSLHPKG